jgi:hypothetical protein
MDPFQTFAPLKRKVGTGVRRETHNEQMVRVHHDEGVAIHIGPESCAGAVVRPYVKR